MECGVRLTTSLITTPAPYPACRSWYECTHPHLPTVGTAVIPELGSPARPSSWLALPPGWLDGRRGDHPGACDRIFGASGTSRDLHSYRRSDNEILAGTVAEHLRGLRTNLDVFFDRDSLRAGSEWQVAIKKQIVRSALVVALIGPSWEGVSPHWEGDDFVMIELRAARSHNKTVIPVLHSGRASLEPSELPTGLRYLCDRHRCELPTTWHGFKESLQRLGTEFETTLFERARLLEGVVQAQETPKASFEAPKVWRVRKKEGRS